MLRFYSAGNDIVDTKQAVADCLEAAIDEQAQECSLLIVHSTMGHSFPDLIAEARARCPHARIVGSTCAGVVDRTGPNESMRALAVMAVYGPPEELAVAGCNRPHDNAFESTVGVAREIRRTNPAVRQVLFQPSVLDFQPIEGTIAGIESVLPNVSIFGALSIDNMKFESNFQFLDDRIIERGAVAVGFADPTLDLVCGATNGFVPVGEPFEITSFDGNAVHALDGEPAWKSITDRLGLPETATMAEVGAVAVLATESFAEPPPEYDSRFIVRGGPIRTPTGDVLLNVNCDQSMRLRLLKRDEQRIFTGVARLVQYLRDRCAGHEVAAIFHADCAARGKAMFDRIAKEELVDIMLSSLAKPQSTPWLGMYGGGELTPLAGRNHILAYTTSLYALLHTGRREN